MLWRVDGRASCLYAAVQHAVVYQGPRCAPAQRVTRVRLHDYKTVLYSQDDSWVAQIPAISGCYAIMPTRESALAELTRVFEVIAGEYRRKGQPLPPDNTEIVHASRTRH